VGFFARKTLFIYQIGFKHTGHNAINDILRNSVYAGLIRVPAMGELPEKYVKAIHPPIISEPEYWQVQGTLDQFKRRKRVQPAEDFPLRGVLRCYCGQMLTASWSKGCRDYYLYYRCMAHAGVNIPGKIIHEKFEELMRAISFRKHHIRFLIETSKGMLREPVKLKNARHKEKQEELRRINEKIYKLEERLVNEEIDGTTYQTWFKKLQQEKRMTEATLNSDEKPKIKSDKDVVEKLLPWLENLSIIYNKSNVTQKHTLVRGLFEDSLVWGQGLFRTKYIHPTFHDNLLKINKKGLLFNEQPFKKSELNLVSTREQIRTATPLPAPAPQAGASTNFATRVFILQT
jgi:site-specific DNA recombinase